MKGSFYTQVRDPVYASLFEYKLSVLAFTFCLFFLAGKHDRPFYT